MFPEDLEASESKCSAKTTKVRSLSSQIKQIKKEWLGDPTAALSEESHPIAAPCHGCRTPDKHSLPFCFKACKTQQVECQSGEMYQ